MHAVHCMGTFSRRGLGFSLFSVGNRGSGLRQATERDTVPHQQCFPHLKLERFLYISLSAFLSKVGFYHLGCSCPPFYAFPCSPGYIASLETKVSFLCTEQSLGPKWVDVLPKSFSEVVPVIQTQNQLPCSGRHLALSGASWSLTHPCSSPLPLKGILRAGLEEVRQFFALNGSCRLPLSPSLLVKGIVPRVSHC